MEVSDENLEPSVLAEALVMTVHAGPRTRLASAEGMN